MSDTSTAINKIYKERQEFIILGLTGRTGSGCSTVADILTKNKKYIEENCKINYGFNNIEERKNKIVFDYLLSKWQKFYKISVTDMLTLFIIDNSIDEVCEFISEEFKKFMNNSDKDVSDSNELKNKFKEKLKKIDYKKIKNSREENRGKLKKIEQNEKVDEDLKEIIESSYNFYFHQLPKFSKKIKIAIDEVYSEMGYTVFYQLIGDNIRSSGKAFDNIFNPDEMYNLSKIINKFTKLIRRKAQISDENCLIVIDAIRNPFEAFYFKDRYSAFYLVSINTEDKIRKNRLFTNLKRNKDEIDAIDNKEYKNKLKKEKIFVSQNIQKCIEISDIHLTNPTYGEKNYSFLIQQLFRYITLIIHPGLVTPTPIERCMQITYSAKLNSGCISRQVGAVITDENYSVKAVGWNDTAAGQIPCLLRSAESLLKFEDKEAFSDYENNNTGFKEVMESKYQKNLDKDKLDGRNLSYCFKDVQNFIEKEKNQVHTRSLHAEENAFLQITKYGGEGIEGGILFTTASPCELCSKKAYQLGIKKIVYIDPYPGIANEHILSIGNDSQRPELQLFHGVTGSAYHKLYQPILSFKDELNWITNIDLKYNNDHERLTEENKKLKNKIKKLEKQINGKKS